MDCDIQKCELLKLKQDFGLVVTDKVYPHEIESLTLIRDLDNSGLGRLYFREVFLCDTLENPDTFMPYGFYAMCVNYSPKFKKNLPLISVPKHSGIRIHQGNYIKDSSGCILVGVRSSNCTLSYSTITLDRIIYIIQNCNIKYFKFS